MHRLELKIPPPVVVVLLALGMYVGDRVLPGTGSTLPWHTALAICAAVAGITVNIAGILAFRRHRTTVNPLQPHRASKLVRDGIFRWTRNPMYLGMVLILISWAFQLASFVAFIGPVLLFAWLTRFQSGGVAALKDTQSQEWVKKVTIDLRAKTTKELASLGYPSIPSDANFFMVHVKRPVQPLVEEFKKKGVLVGRPFPPLNEHLRVSIGTSDEMNRFMVAFKDIMSQPKAAAKAG